MERENKIKLALGREIIALFSFHLGMVDGQ